MRYARLAELADALDLGSSGRPWGFKSLVAHQETLETKRFKGLILCCVHSVSICNFFCIEMQG